MAKRISDPRGLCIACPPGAPLKAKEWHHILPVQYGGPADGALAHLCPSCHTDVHSYGEKLSSGRITVEDINGTSALRQLAIKVYEQKREWIASEGKAPDARRRIVAHLTSEELEMVHVLRDSGGYNSIEVMLKTMVRRDFDKLIKGK